MSTETKITPEWQLCAAERVCHAIAVLHLKDHPWGFTREDVELLGYVSEICQNEGLFGETMLEEMGSLQARIQALLPPENA